MGFLKTIRILLIILLFSVPPWTSPAWAQLKAMTVLLPSKDFSEPVSAEKMLKVAADGSSPIKPASTAWLQFDLQGIPADARITRVTLRLEGHPADPARPNPQLVKIFADGQQEGKALAKWLADDRKKAFAATSDALRQTVAHTRTEKKPLLLMLRSTSRLSNWDYYSTQAYGDNCAGKPRLMVEFNLDAPAPTSPEKTDWRFYMATHQFKVKPFQADKTILSNPVFYDGNAFLFAKTADATDLYAFHFNGRESWRRAIDYPPASHARVSYDGMLYSIGQGRIAAYDLNRNGAPQRQTSVGEDFKLSLPPTLGADGSLYFVRYGTLYGLNPQWQELWRYPVIKKGSAFSPAVTGPAAPDQAYVLARIKDQNMMIALDTAVGSSLAQYPFDNNLRAFHAPVVIADTGHDYICYSAYSDQNGLLACNAGGQRIWASQGTISQPIASRDGKMLYAIQNGRLKAFDRFNGRETAVSRRKDLAATSNLVLDGDDHIYFWSNGVFFSFDKACKLLADQKLADLAASLELLFAPDGTLYARNKKTRQLALILPTLDKVTVSSDNLQNHTIYSADTVRIAPGLQLDRKVSIALKARDSISIGRGFRVQKGARLICKTGY